MKIRVGGLSLPFLPIMLLSNSQNLYLLCLLLCSWICLLCSIRGRKLASFPDIRCLGTRPWPPGNETISTAFKCSFGECAALAVPWLLPRPLHWLTRPCFDACSWWDSPLFPQHPPIMPALFLILLSAYYARNYAGIIDAGLPGRRREGEKNHHQKTALVGQLYLIMLEDDYCALNTFDWTLALTSQRRPKAIFNLAPRRGEVIVLIVCVCVSVCLLPL